MPLPAESVAAASSAWIWIPDNATVAETDDFTIVRMPDYFTHPLSVSEFHPAPGMPLAAAVAAVIERARSFQLPELQWQIYLESPPGLADVLAAHGATLELTLDVLASDLRDGAASLPPPSVDVAVRWATDWATARDGSAVGVAVFGGSMPPDDQVAKNAGRDAAGVPAGDGGMAVAYVDGSPAGSGGVTLVAGVARLWGGAVLQPARGLGVYRAVLGARLDYAVAHGATMALVKGRNDTSGPILRRAGFAGYGQEPIYRVPL